MGTPISVTVDRDDLLHGKVHIPSLSADEVTPAEWVALVLEEAEILRATLKYLSGWRTIAEHVFEARHKHGFVVVGELAFGPGLDEEERCIELLDMQFTSSFGGAHPLRYMMINRRGEFIRWDLVESAGGYSASFRLLDSDNLLALMEEDPRLHGRARLGYRLIMAMSGAVKETIADRQKRLGDLEHLLKYQLGLSLKNIRTG